MRGASSSSSVCHLDHFYDNNTNVVTGTEPYVEFEYDLFRRDGEDYTLVGLGKVKGTPRQTLEIVEDAARELIVEKSVEWDRHTMGALVSVYEVRRCNRLQGPWLTHSSRKRGRTTNHLGRQETYHPLRIILTTISDQFPSPNVWVGLHGYSWSFSVRRYELAPTNEIC